MINKEFQLRSKLSRTIPDLIRDIKNFIEQLGVGKIPQSDFFTESTYQNSQNKTMPCYKVTKKGCQVTTHEKVNI